MRAVRSQTGSAPRFRFVVHVIESENRQRGARPFRAQGFVVASWAAVGVWACFIFFMSAHTAAGLEEGIGLVSQLFNALKAWQAAAFGPDADVVSSLGHFCEYLVLGALLANALRFYMPLRRAWAVALACASFYGVTDELHQLFVPTRTCDPLDWAVDTIAAALGSGAFCAVALHRRRR